GLRGVSERRCAAVRYQERQEFLMSQATIAPPTIENLADLVERLGDIPLERIRFRPAPGAATEKDLIEIERRGDSPLCELVDGTVVDRAIGLKESLVTYMITCHIGSRLDRVEIVF